MILADFHVHMYRCFNLSGLFSAAAANFNRLAGSLGTPSCQGVLCLTDSKGYETFDLLRSGENISPWVIESTEEEQSLQVVNDGYTLTVIAGRQINSRERIEVLALGTTESFADDIPLAETLDLIKQSEGLAVLPWGAGKWTGKRGVLVRDVFASQPGVFAGDNGGRPQGWPLPVFFSEAKGRNMPVLAGSDPLPIPQDQCRVGSYGALSRQTLQEHKPARHLLALVRKGHFQKIYGSRISPVTFCVRQVQLRLPGRCS